MYVSLTLEVKVSFKAFKVHSAVHIIFLVTAKLSQQIRT